MGVDSIEERSEDRRRERRRPSIALGRGPGRARAGGPPAARPLPPRGRPGRARAARRALPAARPPARPPLPARRRAARRPDPGRVARAAQGDRPLRPGPRDGVLVVRGADDPRRAQAPLPRQGLVGPRPARPAGARGQGRPGRATRCRASSAARRRRRRSPSAPGRSLEQVLEAREASGRLPRGLARPPAHGRRRGGRLLRRRRSAPTTRASASPRTPRPSSA